MKKVAAITLFLAYSINCFTQMQSSLAGSSNNQYLRKSKVLTRYAWVSTGVGAVVIIGSAINHANLVKGRNLINEYWSSGGYTPGSTKPIPAYTARYVAGGACIIGGVLLFAAAAKNKKKAAAAGAFLKMQEVPVLKGMAMGTTSVPSVGYTIAL